MYQMKNITLSPLAEPMVALREFCAKKTRLQPGEILDLRILKKSLDCRKKDRIVWVYTVAFSTKRRLETALCRRAGIEPYRPVEFSVAPVGRSCRPVIVGSGPAGLFCAYVLALAGAKPLVLERGDDVDRRTQLVRRFWQDGVLDCESNVQFGEGGAGTFSDGKLNTGVRDERIQWILQTFHRFGAPESVCYDAKPHVGTDVLVSFVKNLRKEIQSLGGQILFRARFEDMDVSDSGIRSITYVSQGERVRIECDRLVLALGHSAHDTFSLLHKRGLALAAMPFAVGVRIEHPQSRIDLCQYGAQALEQFSLPPAEYKLAYHTPSCKVHTFCMCPGGYVVGASSHSGSVVTNGMSRFARDGVNANSALLVSVPPELFASENPLCGVEYLRALEEKAFQMAGGDYRAPAQTLEDFFAKRPTRGWGSVQPSYLPGVTPVDLNQLFDPFVSEALREGIEYMQTKFSAFCQPDAVLTAPETRSSSPVRILRDQSLQSNVSRVYPCGEGAGYAGGIVSAALDGLRVAQSILNDLS